MNLFPALTKHFLGIAHRPISTLYPTYFGLNVDSIRLKFQLKLNGQSFLITYPSENHLPE